MKLRFRLHTKWLLENQAENICQTFHIELCLPNVLKCSSIDELYACCKPLYKCGWALISLQKKKGSQSTKIKDNKKLSSRMWS